MSNFIYKKAKEGLLNGLISVANPLKVAFIDTSIYTPNESSDEYISDIPALAITQKSTTLQNVTSFLGTVDASDLIVDEYNGAPFGAIVLYQDSGSDSSSRLIFYINDSEGLPFPRNTKSFTIDIAVE